MSGFVAEAKALLGELGERALSGTAADAAAAVGGPFGYRWG
jgi:hypothetical protein